MTDDDHDEPRDLNIYQITMGDWKPLDNIATS
jgi:hypothetical protein